MSGKAAAPEGPKAPQLRDQLQGEALYGVNPVLGALEALRREVHAPVCAGG